MKYEDVYMVGEKVEVDVNDEWVQGKVAFIDSNANLLRYLIRVDGEFSEDELIRKSLWNAQDLKECFTILFRDTVLEPGGYQWPYPFEIRPLPNKYNLKRTTFLEGVELW